MIRVITYPPKILILISVLRPGARRRRPLGPDDGARGERAAADEGPAALGGGAGLRREGRAARRGVRGLRRAEVLRKMRHFAVEVSRFLKFRNCEPQLQGGN